jgi:glutamine amidotransferase/cyclase
MPTVQVLDYISGNVRSLHNAIEKLGYKVEWIRDPAEIECAQVMPSMGESTVAAF